MTTSLSSSALMRTLLVLATAAGFSVASIYYAQPILPLIGDNLHLGISSLGLIPTLTQAGYALGILFLLPLGDRFDRRIIIMVKSFTLALMLVLYSFSTGEHSLLALSLLLGASATVAQDIVPAAAILSPSGKQGKAVGMVMTGLLLGILLSRTVSGLVSAAFGWRTMYQLAALSIALIGLALWRVLPRFAAQAELVYPSLMKSMVGLWSRHPALRRAALAQGLLSIGFSAFWSMLAVMLSQQFHMGSAVAGAFGIAGAAGALAAPLSGSLADKLGANRVTQYAAALATVSFGLMIFLPLLSPFWQLVMIALCAVGFDLGLQSSLVAHQTLVYRLDPQARGRLNALLFTGVFIGMAVGSILGSAMWEEYGWMGVVMLAVVASAGGLLVRLAEQRQRDARTNASY
ncbi:MFS transporter [Atlantibacter subterranea]|uniref:MFS transporter n=1 Tax=Atlantibacter subterraneus TaxID=255519 RepID=UPI0020C3E535|nr:MFS transporter [Atlantibacter subterranea]UTJ49097.1 MFS transporter [Atlantibacter subterranea]